jgi:type IV pilus assembly protein PilO
MLANRTSRWSIATALICLAVLAVSWFLLISPRRADASAVRGQAVQTDAQAARLEVQLAGLKSDFASLSKRKAELKALKEQLPPTADIPDLVRDLQTYATQAGVSLDSIVPATAALLSPDGSTSTSTGVATTGSLVSIPVTVAVTGDYFEVSLFTKYLQTKLTRSFLISGVNATTSAAATTSETATAAPTPTPTADATANTSVTLGISGSVFVLLDGTSSLAEVTKDAQAAAAAAQSSAGTRANTSSTR